MVGHNSDRFEQLSDNNKLKQELLCGICLKVINNAIQTQCKHNFCSECLKRWLEQRTNKERKDCPECRHLLTSRKRSKTVANSNDIQLVANVWVEKNRTINNIIGSLKVRCDNQCNGCQHVMPLDQLAVHLNNCHHKICSKCGFNHIINEETCIDLLKKKCETLMTENIIMKRKSDEYINELKDTNQKFVVLVNWFNFIVQKHNKLDAECNEVSKTSLTLYEKIIEFKEWKHRLEETLKVYFPQNKDKKLRFCTICDETSGQLIDCSNSYCKVRIHRQCIESIKWSIDGFLCPKCRRSAIEKNSYKITEPIESYISNNNQSVVKYPVTVIATDIIFGTFVSKIKDVLFDSDGIKFSTVYIVKVCGSIDTKFQSFHLSIPFHNINHIICSTHCTSLSLLAILVDNNTNLQINSCLRLSTESSDGFTFNVNSNDVREKYILISLTKWMTNTFVDKLRQVAHKYNNKCICDSLNVTHFIDTSMRNN